MQLYSRFSTPIHLQPIEIETVLNWIVAYGSLPHPPHTIHLVSSADKIKRHATTYDELLEVLKTVTANDLASHLTADMYDPTGPGRRVDIMWAPIVESMYMSCTIHILLYSGN